MGDSGSEGFKELNEVRKRKKEALAGKGDPSPAKGRNPKKK